MKRIGIVLLSLALAFPLAAMAAESTVDADQWKEDFGSMWSLVIPTAFVFDETPAEGTLVSGNMGESFALAVIPAGEEGKIEVMVDIYAPEDDGEEADEDADGEAAVPYDTEKTYVLIAFNAAIKAQRPDLTANNELINSLSMAISKEIFLDAEFAAAFDGVEKVLELDGDIVYKEYISSEEGVMRYTLIL